MIDVVGLGPGAFGGRTADAAQALSTADVLVGYTAYIALIRAEYPEKPVFETAMRGERARCEEALRLSRTGKRVALICSGDAQVYGMAALLLELAQETDDIRVVPGVTAALSAAALLGAPLSGDFAAISLSDLMTPWEMIERRLHAAAQGDFVIVLYNPMSRKRTDQLRRACEILLKYRGTDTVCGWARMIGREGEQTGTLTLAELKEAQVDMFTTVIIGNSSTLLRFGRMLTPRGYAL